MDGEKGHAMARSIRNLTILLGKLGIAKDRFVIDHDAITHRFPHAGFPKGRPPWRTGIEYGLSLYEATSWVKRYIKAKVKNTP
jgi:hypothetical protein